MVLSSQLILMLNPSQASNPKQCDIAEYRMDEEDSERHTHEIIGNQDYYPKHQEQKRS
jgi:hypothetical protein